MIGSFIVFAYLMAEGTESAKVDANELLRLQGTWKLVAVEEVGGNVPKEELKIDTVIVKDDNWVVNLSSGGRVEAKIVLLDPKAKPSRMTLKIDEHEFNAIYLLKDNTLKANVADQNQPAPADFRPVDSNSGGVSTYRRKPQKP